MPSDQHAQKKQRISRIAARARRRHRGEAASRVGTFVETFWARVPAEDVLAADEKVLLGAALSAWQWMSRRQPGRTKVRAFNPTEKARGFTLGRTVIEIIGEDMPFLVDSVTSELNRTGLVVHLVVHPLLGVRRDREGRLMELGPAAADGHGLQAESLMHVVIDEQAGHEELAAIQRRIEAVLADVRAAVEDWHAMRLRTAEAIAELESSRGALHSGEIDETAAFLRWLEDDHFTFLGYRDYRFPEEDGATLLEIDAQSGLGILRDQTFSVFDALERRAVLSPAVAAFVSRRSPLVITKANRRSTVERSVHLDVIAVRRFGEDGRVTGSRLFVGLFTSSVYATSASDVPVLRGKIDAVLDLADLDPGSHDGKGLLHVLETMPRDELLQTDVDTLLTTSTGILALQARQRAALFLHEDPFQRFASCLVYVPRDRYHSRLRRRIQEILEQGLAGKVSTFRAQVSEAPLARLHYLVRTVPGAERPRRRDEIEQELIAAAREWRDDLGIALAQAHGRERGAALLQKWGDAFPTAYRERTEIEAAVADIERLERTLAEANLGIDLQAASDNDVDGELRLKLYHADGPLALSDILPVLENMGLRVLDELPHRIRPSDGAPESWIQEFRLSVRNGRPVVLAQAKGLFEECLVRVWRQEVDDDGFNALALLAGLSVRRIAVLRAYCKFLLQAGIPFSQAYMEGTLARHSEVARRIVELFEALFDPDRGQRAERDAVRLRRTIERALEAVPSLDEDRILRRFTNAVACTLRTNWFRTDDEGTGPTHVALKLDSRSLDELPLPRPHVEVFVHGPRTEGIHLRGGDVARGGIRWSDRREDFRTEVLGLMKSQMTKNAVIVPVGAKGGFVVKHPPPAGDRDAAVAEAVACYTTFISALLDVTDNLDGSRVVPPPRVVRRDGDDPYLVVAADKGTASFSDVANAVAERYGYWLGDAFASGGSSGYDHKEMGITARGAWESIKRHFRESGRDCMREDFTCVGVGDMSGDVFGNGALYSEHMRLLGAFNHLHIFVDPNPDAAASWHERKRLYELPRSTWEDYDKKLISKGGGVFPRSAKQIKVTAAMRKIFPIGNKSTATPNELIRAMLAARVDLLWFGGIGTYVKARYESHGEVGDRANDGHRVNGEDLAASIVGEGANLALTQRGRVEYALSGGRINTDFIDNSAGVDCSDHEVNIKILLRPALDDGTLTRAARDKLLRRMTEEVATLVLRDNYRQSVALSEAERQALALLEDHTRFLRDLESRGRLDRGVEALPDDKALEERRAQGQGLTRPELAILLAYSKILLHEEVLGSALPADPHLVATLGRYFPGVLRKRFAHLLPDHRLRRELIATYVANTLVNRTGPGFVSAVHERTGAPPPAIARAYLVCRGVFRMGDRWQDVDELDETVPSALQGEMRLAILDLIKRGTQWFVRNGDADAAIDAEVDRYAPDVALLEKRFESLLPHERKGSRDAVAERFVAQGAPQGLARRIANLELLIPACDIVRIGHVCDLPAGTVARAYYALGVRLGLDWLRDAALGLAHGDPWRKAAVLGQVDELYAVQTSLTTALVRSVGVEAESPERVARWLADQGWAVDRVLKLVGTLRTAPSMDLARLSVATADIRALTA